MADTIKDKIIRLYGGLGQPAQDELGPTDKDAIAERCLENLNDKIGSVILRSITTVASTESYTPATTTKRVLKVFANDASSKMITNSLSSVGLGTVQFSNVLFSTGLSGWDEFKMYSSALHLLNSWDRINDEFKWRYLNSKIYIYPIPETVYTLIYLSQENFTWSTVPTEMYDYLYAYYANEHLMILASKRIGIQGVSAEGHSTAYPARDLQALAKEYADKAKTEMNRLKKLQEMRI